MKKLLLIVCIILLLGVKYSFAQEYPDMVSGMGSVFVIMDKITIGKNYSTFAGKDALHLKRTNGLFCAVSVSLPGVITGSTPSKTFETMIELSYSKQGAKQSVNLFNQQLPESKAKLDLNVIRLGILFKYKFINKSAFMPSLLSGFSAGVGWTNGDIIVKRHDSNENEILGTTESCPFMYYDVNFGGGVDIVAHKNGGYKKIVGIELRYNLGLNTIEKPDETYPDKIKLKNSTYSINFVLYYMDLIENFYYN